MTVKHLADQLLSVLRRTKASGRAPAKKPEPDDSGWQIPVVYHGTSEYDPAAEDAP